MKAYLLSAAGVIFLSVVVSLLIPDGKLNKTITFIMRLICILVLIQPVTGIFKSATEGTGAEIIDYAYVCSVYSDHQSAELEKLLEEEFATEVVCNVNVESEDGQFKVTGVEVKLNDESTQLIEEIYAYLVKLDYINITVYAQST